MEAARKHTHALNASRPLVVGAISRYKHSYSNLNPHSETRDYQHTPGAVRIHEVAIWGKLSTSYFSKSDRWHSAGNDTRHLLSG